MDLNYSLLKRYNLNSRLDCFVVWNHGLEHIQAILKIIREANELEIILIEQYVAKSMKKLINRIYSFDYAPIYHLKSKLKYLNKLKPEVIFIFVKNIDPQIEIVGEGSFRHVESNTIKKIKQKIRNQFNPKDANGLQSHNHVIHATDNQYQTNSILKLIGFTNGINELNDNKKIISSPYYISEPSKFSILNINFNDLFCQNAVNKKELKILRVEDSIQYRSIQNINIYKKYISEFRGTILKQDYTQDKFLNLKKNFKYLDSNNKDKFIIVNKMPNKKFIIRDGLHRAALHLFAGNRFITSCLYE